MLVTKSLVTGIVEAFWAPDSKRRTGTGVELWCGEGCLCEQETTVEVVQMNDVLRLEIPFLK